MFTSGKHIVIDSVSCILWTYCATERLQVTGHHLDLTAILIGLLLGLAQGLCVSMGCICQVSKLCTAAAVISGLHHVYNCTLFLFFPHTLHYTVDTNNMSGFTSQFSDLGSVPLLRLLHVG